MTNREPLMLSDTAMVLLREYVDLKDHFTALLGAMTQDLSPTSPPLNDIAKILTNNWSVTELSTDAEIEASAKVLMNNWSENDLSLPIFTLPARIEHVEEELLQELWLLWTSPDVTPIRTLDWHIVFDEALMAAAEKRLASRPEPFRPEINPDAVGQMVGMRELETETGLINQLENAYKVGLAARKASADKDQS
jgi:hypothetical protein